MGGVVEPMGFEEDVKEILDDHGERITKLEIDNAGIKEKLNNIEAQTIDVKSAVVRLESTVLQTNNSVLQTLSQVVTNTSNNATQIVTTKNNNITEIIIKVLTIIGSLLVGFFAAKGINVSM